MKIAQIAPLFETVPPPGYGGTERVIHALCEGLTDLGHEVTLFSSGDSTSSASLVSVVPKALRVLMSRDEMSDVAPHLHLRMLADVYEQAADFDVIHSHIDIWTLPFATASDTPTVLTMHGRLDLEHVRQTMQLYPDVPLVSISNHQREALAGQPITWASTVYNGLDLDQYLRARPERGDHLAFVGRISPEKGPALAVDIARRTGRQLRVAAKVDPFDIDYYRTEIDPLFQANDVDFIGEIMEPQKPDFYASAAATLFPSDWPEPFGLVMIESMAAGTPVIALRRGAVPEILVDGVTGFICDDVDDMVAAVARIDQIDPDTCRQRASDFSNAAMCASYERVYQELVNSTTRRELTGAS